MKYFLSQKDINDFDKLLFYKETNIGVAELINFEMNEGYHSLYPIKIKNNKEYGGLLLEESGLNDEENDLIKIKDDYELFHLNELDINEYFNNDFYKNIQIKTRNCNDLSLFLDFYDEYEPFIFDEIRIKKPYYKEIYQVGYFKEKFPFIALKENNRVWMSVTPHEINTMKSAIETSKGNVLVFGLGLGYFVYMISNKNNVNKITIIEQNKDVIRLFNDSIYPQFTNKNIEIINGNAFRYFNNQFIDEKHIDSVFIDTYHSGEDIAQFIKYKNLENKLKKDLVLNYWIEDSLFCYFRRYLISLINEEIGGFKDSNYIKSKSIHDSIINALHFQLKEREIKTYKDIEFLLEKEEMNKIIKNLFLKQ